MQIRIHFPTTEKGKKLLQDKIDEVHASLIMDRVNALECPYEQKVTLLEQIKERMAKGVTS